MPGLADTVTLSMQRVFTVIMSVTGIMDSAIMKKKRMDLRYHSFQRCPDRMERV